MGSLQTFNLKPSSGHCVLENGKCFFYLQIKLRFQKCIIASNEGPSTWARPKSCVHCERFSLRPHKELVELPAGVTLHWAGWTSPRFPPSLLQIPGEVWESAPLWGGWRRIAAGESQSLSPCRRNPQLLQLPAAHCIRYGAPLSSGNRSAALQASLCGHGYWVCHMWKWLFLYC